MNRQQQLRSDLRDEDKLLNHDLRITSVEVDEDDPTLLVLVVEDAYGAFPGTYIREPAFEASDLVGKVRKVWGFPYDFADPDAGLSIDCIEHPDNPAPSLLLVPKSVCAGPAVPALHRLIDIVTNLQSTAVADLVHHVLGSDEVYPYFFTAKGSSAIHHAYEGGLAEHSMECAEIVSLMPTKYFSSELARDITIAAATLHDLGKVAWARMGYRNPEIPHETRSMLMIADALAKFRARTDGPTADLLTFLISKECRAENAVCPEAVAVNLADRMSACAEARDSAFAKVPDGYGTVDRAFNGRRKRFLRLPVSPSDV